MKEGQDVIYYMAADSKAAAENAPFVEQLVKRDFEVPLSALQDWCHGSLHEARAGHAESGC